MQIGVYYMGCTLAPRGMENMIEPSMCGGNATFCQITLTTCFILLQSRTGGVLGAVPSAAV